MTNEELRSARIAEAKRRNGDCEIGVDCYDAFVNHLAGIYETNWTPPPPVDPDLLVARVWAAGKSPGDSEGFLSGRYDKSALIIGFLAGAGHGRKAPRVWTDDQVERAARVRWESFTRVTWERAPLEYRVLQITAMRAALEALEAPE